MGPGNSRRLQQPVAKRPRTASTRQKQRQQQQPLGGGKRQRPDSSGPAPGQSSILSFLVPKLGRAADRPANDHVDDGESESEVEVEVTGVTPAKAAPPLPSASPAPAKSQHQQQQQQQRQASLLSFFCATGAGVKSAAATSPPKKSPLPPPCGTWKSASGRTVCPPVKWVDGTDLTVDAFNYGAQARCRGYLLSHFHSDHYCGLGRLFDGQLLASPPTAALARLRLGVRLDRIRTLELQKWHEVPGAQVLLLDANHCPGSAMFVFRLHNGRRHLHTGDFRASPELVASVLGCLGESPEIDSLYLDTTYCSREFDFPPQAQVIESVLRLAEEFAAEFPKHLIACGSYSLGKERVFVSLAKRLGCRAGVDPAKHRLLSALGDPGIADWVVRNAPSGPRSRLQVLPLRCVTHAGLRRYLGTVWRGGPQVDGVLGIAPTGWSQGARGATVAPGVRRLHGGAGGGRPHVAVYAVAYSEHSSFSELRDFVRRLRPLRILPTVNWHRRDACSLMRAHFTNWLAHSDV